MVFLDGGGTEMEELVGVGQVKWNSGEFVPDLERFGNSVAVAMGGACVVQAGEWQFWVHLGLFWMGASVFLEILLRFVFGREAANVGLFVPPPTSIVALGKSSFLHL